MSATTDSSAYWDGRPWSSARTRKVSSELVEEQSTCNRTCMEQSQRDEIVDQLFMQATLLANPETGTHIIVQLQNARVRVDEDGRGIQDGISAMCTIFLPARTSIVRCHPHQGPRRRDSTLGRRRSSTHSELFAEKMRPI